MKALIVAVDVIEAPLPGAVPVMTDKKISVLIPFADGIEKVFKTALFYELLENGLSVVAKRHPGEVTIDDLFPEAFA